jgi:sugar lactone lactonase YvrE
MLDLDRTTAIAKVETAERTTEERVIFKNVGLDTPEGVLHDTASDTYLVSNIQGDPFAADDGGFVSKLSPDGQVLQLKFIDGAQPDIELSSPKGMVVVGEHLFIADMQHVRSFELATGKAKASVHFPGSTMLNDIAASADGTLYVSDTGLVAGKDGNNTTGNNALYKLVGETITRIAEGSALSGPNGLWVDQDGLLMVTYAGNSLLRFALPEIDKLAIGKKSKALEPSERVTLPNGALGGIVRIDPDRYLVSSWEAKAILLGKLDAKLSGKFEALLTDLESPADISFDAKRQRVLVPLFTRNELHCIPLPR